MSRLYQELTLSELTELVEFYFGTRDFQAKLMTGGLFNTTYLLDLPQGKFVLRLGAVNRHLLLPFEKNLMLAEKTVYQWLHEAGIPTSEVVLTDTSRKIIDRDLMIVRFIPSENLSVLTESAEAKKLYEQAGQVAARMHQISNARFGRVSQMLGGQSFSRWSDYLMSEVRDVSEALEHYQLFSEMELAQIRFAFEQHQDLLDEITQPSLIHADLWAGNVLVSTDSADHRKLAAIIDTDRALFGDPAFEFASPWMMNEDFIRGYGREIKQNSIRKQLYQLIYQLIDTYVWAIQYENPENARAAKENALKLLKELL